MEMEDKMKYRKIFVPHQNFRFDIEPLRELSKEIVYVCDGPMFDDMLEDSQSHRFEKLVVEALEDFDENRDAVAFYGDPIIFAMMVYWLGSSTDSINVLRFSNRTKEYFCRKISLSGLSFYERKNQEYETST